MASIIFELTVEAIIANLSADSIIFRQGMEYKSIVKGNSLSGLFDALYVSSARAANSVPS